VSCVRLSGRLPAFTIRDTGRKGWADGEVTADEIPVEVKMRVVLAV
jgi:hypothetical protein